MKTKPDTSDEGIAAWLDDGEDGLEICVDVRTMFEPVQAGVTITTERAKRLAAELLEIVAHVDKARLS